MKYIQLNFFRGISQPLLKTINSGAIAKNTDFKQMDKWHNI